MNPHRHFGDGTVCPARSPERLPFDKPPDHWDPGRIPDYESNVGRHVLRLIRNDMDEYPPGVEYRGPGVPARHGYKYLLANGGRADPAGIVAFGGVKNTDRNGKQDKFTRALQATVIDGLVKMGLRSLWGGGGASGHPMDGTSASCQEIARKRGVYPHQAEPYHVLAKILSETPHIHAEPEAVIRPQGSLTTRYDGLILAACAGCYYAHGLGGEGGEQGPQLLENQLFGTPGPTLVGVTLGILVDRRLTREECERGGGLPYGTYYFDYFDLRRRIFVGAANAHQKDFRPWIRVSIDDDPELPVAEDTRPLTAAKIVAEEFLRWVQMRLVAGIAQKELAAIRKALADV